MIVAQQIVAFRRRYPELATQDGAYFACSRNAEFARLCGGATLHLIGSWRRYPRRADDYPARDPYFYHMVALVNGKVYDWSRRHLDPSAAWPHVESLAALRREWIKIAPNPRYLGVD